VWMFNKWRGTKCLEALRPEDRFPPATHCLAHFGKCDRGARTQCTRRRRGGSLIFFWRLTLKKAGSPAPRETHNEDRFIRRPTAEAMIGVSE
jgi:hypothetical protein